MYRGRTAVPGAVATLNHLADEGLPGAFVTNNASRPPSEVAAHLASLGIDLRSSMVVTSAEAAAQFVALHEEKGTTVLAVGGPGVASALRAQGLDPVSPGSPDVVPSVVVQGAGAEVTWSDLAAAAYAVQAGARWVVTNLDMTIPMPQGLAPGNGTLVGAVAATTTAQPIVVGKPQPYLFDLGISRLGLSPSDVLVIGDRLDTDVLGAHAVGAESMLVLTGAHGPEDVARADPADRPTYVGDDLSHLLTMC